MSADEAQEHHCGADDAESQARAIALRALARREHTVAELRALLARRRCAPPAIDAVIGQLEADGYLDDAGFARRFAADKIELEGWGRQRIAHALRQRGIAEEHLEAALAARDYERELEAAITLLARRFAALSDARAQRRAWQFLARRGYASEVAYDAVRAFAKRCP